jgi:hypothetical protein
MIWINGDVRNSSIRRREFIAGLGATKQSNYLIDIEDAVIFDVEATPARTYHEVAATKTMLDRTEEELRLPSRADKVIE